MFTLRCTAKLIKRLKLVEFGEVTPTTKLGDLYANLIYVRRQQFILAAFERTLLPVLIPASPSATLVRRLTDALGDVLRSLGVPAEAIEAEVSEMDRVAIGKTASKHVLGIMNQFAFMLEFRDPLEPLTEAAVWLAKSPCRARGEPGGYGFPDQLTEKVLSGKKSNLRLVHEEK